MSFCVCKCTHECVCVCVCVCLCVCECELCVCVCVALADQRVWLLRLPSACPEAGRFRGAGHLAGRLEEIKELNTQTHTPVQRPGLAPICCERMSGLGST